jgi:hypothetical protein
VLAGLDPKGPGAGAGEIGIGGIYRDQEFVVVPPVRVALSTARLVAADGDQLPPLANGNTRPGDGRPDWSVGELRSHAVAERGRQGFAFQTGVAKPACYRAPNQNNAANEITGGKYTPTDRSSLEACLRSFDWLLSS